MTDHYSALLLMGPRRNAQSLLVAGPMQVIGGAYGGVD